MKVPFEELHCAPRRLTALRFSFRRTSKLQILNQGKKTIQLPLPRSALFTPLLFSMSSRSLSLKVPSERRTGERSAHEVLFFSSSSDPEEDDAVGRYARQLSGHASHVKSEPAEGWIMGGS